MGVTHGVGLLSLPVVLFLQVEFEDGSELTLKREDIWAEDEELPRKVQARLVRSEP